MPNLKSVALALGALLAPAFAAPSPADVDDLLPDRYIVTLKNDLVSPQVDSHVSWVNNVHRRDLERRAGGVDKVWSKSFKGYSGQFDEITLEDIRANTEVSPFSTGQKGKKKKKKDKGDDRRDDAHRN